MARWLWLSALVLVIDQATKVAALLWLEPHVPLPVLAPVFNLTLLFNEGAAFSFLADAGGLQRWGLAAFALAMSAALGVWLVRLPRTERRLAVALALVIGGALGNLIDRVLYGHVVDFIQVYLPFIPLRLFNPWPAFNIADSAISIGVAFLLVTTLREGRPRP
ncbi:signal peptidase II [Thiococcus pfennigii]|jgi:signal peptidase II|uniref:signal peptidase II n=1 Tax=Thiococcus pfennigii TaxID=1057 RepID=UPI0019041231|nr:signal peptidase II [Thiococcus pfennigii]MBK1730600.1 signal peptidase II [Thiococcus pfennigii]